MESSSTVSNQTPVSNPLVDPRAERADSYLRRSLRSFARQKGNWFAIIVIAAGLIMAFIPIEWLPYDPTMVNPAERLIPPDWSFGTGQYVFGTDVLGRDIFSRSIFAARWTYLVSISAVLLASLVGTVTGLTAGFNRGRVDTVVSRLIDIQLAFPIVLLAISVLAVAGPSLLNMILVLGLVDWARYARVVRGESLSVRERDFVEAARAVGMPTVRIMHSHILPNVLSSIIVLTTFSAARLMLTESALSFLGLGVAPPATTWGGMIGSGRDYIVRAWWITAFPGAFITVTVLAINLLGDGLRDAFDPQNEGG